MLFKNKKIARRKIKIAYLLEDTSLCGGVKIVFEHALMLSESGFLVTIVTRGEKPDYFELGNVELIRIHNTFAESSEILARFDIVIATFFPQLIELFPLQLNLVHFSQGFEADCPFWAEKIEDIKKAYSLPVPKITISKRVESVLRKSFSHTEYYYIPQGVDLRLFYPKKSGDTINKVVIVGIWENEIKGIRFAIEGFLRAKNELPHLRLVRISPLPLSDDERSLYSPDEYYSAMHPKNMAEIYRRCDLAIVPSLEGEGFGLPAIEAMACGLPVILTRIHSFLSFHPSKNYAYFVSQKEPEEIAEGIINICRRPGLASELADKGLRVAAEYPLGKTADRLIAVIGHLTEKQPLMKKVCEVSYIFIRKPQFESSMEVALLRELSMKTFSGQNPVKIIAAKAPGLVSVREILEDSQAPFIAISLDETTFFSTNWISPLIDALNQDIEIVSPVCSDFFDIDMPYYSPSTLDDVAERMAEKYRGKYPSRSPFPLICFVAGRKSLEHLPPETLVSELPDKLKSAVVPASLTHRFGDYYSSRREDILPFVPHGVKKVLDVGCARGFLGELIRKERGCRVFGLEINTEVAETAKARLDEVFCLDIENASLPFDRDLDVIIFADILEHLIDPWQVLKNTGDWLKPDGLIIASIPNTSHYSIILDLIRGRWDYIPFGLLCISHIRFFTRATIEEMFIKAGYALVTLEPQAYPSNAREDLVRMLGEKLNMPNVSDDIFHPGYYAVAKKKI